jgi:hypothetical protein
MFDERFGEERPKINMWVALTREESRGLLEELATEGSPFRNALKKNPRAALARLPIDISALRLPDRIELPPAEHFRELTDRLAQGELGEPSVPAGYALFMLVLPFGCPTLGSDDDDDDDDGGGVDDWDEDALPPDAAV